MILSLGGKILDWEHDQLAKILATIDAELRDLNTRIAASADPDGDGLCDLAEFFIGSGFVAIQRYLNETRVSMRACKEKGYDCLPNLNANIAYARAINAVANYWKHSADWAEAERSGSILPANHPANTTARQLERIGELGDYVCADALYLMLPGQPLELTGLMPKLSDWRGHLAASTTWPSV